MTEWLSSFIIVAGIAMVLYIVLMGILKPLAKIENDTKGIKKDIGTLNEYLQNKYWKDDKS